MKLKLYQVDAFAETVFTGNPAAIIPLENWLDEGLMQRIAMENNLSETAYFVKTDAGYHIRWFTPAFEIDLCGHATLASAYVIKNFLEPHLASISFSTQRTGLLRASAKDGMYALDFPSSPPEDCSVPGLLFKAIGTKTVIEVLKSRDYFVVLPDEDAVRDAEPDFMALRELDATGVIITAKGRSADVVSRCFYPRAGIPEDAVTGSAHCSIVPYWAKKLGRSNLHCLQLSARGGELWCELNGDRVAMSGKCALYMQGEIDI